MQNTRQRIRIPFVACFRKNIHYTPISSPVTLLIFFKLNIRIKLLSISVYSLHNICRTIRIRILFKTCSQNILSSYLVCNESYSITTFLLILKVFLGYEEEIVNKVPCNILYKSKKIIFVVVVRVFTKENIFETKQFLQAKVTTLKTFVILFDRKHISGCLSFP